MKHLFVFILSFGLACSPASACTVFAYGSADGNSRWVAKNLDWYWGQGRVYVNKRGMAKEALVFDGIQGPKWTSKYASLTLSQTGLEFPWEGFNEAGLSVNVLQLMTSAPPPASDPRPPLDQVQFIQYLLDTAANLNEATAAAKAVRVREPMMVHYFVCERSGACAVFEYIDGDLRITTGTDLSIPALANDSYADSLKYAFQRRGREADDTILKDGSRESFDRFTRAAILTAGHPAESEAVSYGFDGLANLTEVWPTWRTYWSFVVNSTRSELSFSTLASPKVKAVGLAEFDLDCRSGVQTIDLNTSSATTPLSAAFESYTEALNRELVEKDGHLQRYEKELVAKYPARSTHCTQVGH